MQEQNDYQTIKEIKISEENKWKTSLEVPKYDENGKLIIYKVDEKEVPKGYLKSIEGTTITNTLIKKEDCQITVNYIDKTTGKILEVEEKVGLEMDKTTTKAHEIQSYKLIEKPETEEYTFTKEKQTVNYYYIQMVENVIEKHIDKTTNKLLEAPTIHKGYEGDVYTTKPKEFKNYKLDETNLPKNQKGTLKKEPVEIIYYYIPKAGQVTINHIDKVTKLKISESTYIDGWVGEKYKTIPKEINGYELEKEIPKNSLGILKNEPIEVNYYYTYKSKVIIDYIDKDTGENLKQEIKNGYETEKIKTNEIEIPYYKLEEKPEIEEYILTKKPIKVTYKYRKLKFNIQIKQTIEKIILNNQENNVQKTFYKLEIPQKQIENNIKIYYKIQVINNSEIKGNTELNNYIPEGYIASKEDNPNWYINENKALLHVNELEIGETREYVLILTNIDKYKIGRIYNKTIAENSTNKPGFKEITLEDNQSEAEFIISISTGIQNNLKEILYIIIPNLIIVAILCIIILRKKSINK